MLGCYEAIVKRLEVREFSSKPVEKSLMLKVLEAGRSSPSSMNRQPWHFILVDDRRLLAELSEAAYTGRYVKDAAFAILVYIDSNARRCEMDGGRAIQTMVLAAWMLGLGSCVVTGVDRDRVGRLVGAPEGMHLLAILPFGYPKRMLKGVKKRKPLGEVASYNSYGRRLET